MISKPSCLIINLDCRPGDKKSCFHAIRAFYNWLPDAGYIVQPPTTRLKPLRVGQGIRYDVPIDDVATLLADTGLRRAELASIRFADIDLARCTVKVKGAKERMVAYGPTTAQLLAAFKPADGTLLGLSKGDVSNTLRRLEWHTKIKCNAHAFRRMFACESIRKGMDSFHVQSLLGHSSLTMTRVYAEQVRSEDAVKAYRPII